MHLTRRALALLTLLGMLVATFHVEAEHGGRAAHGDRPALWHGEADDHGHHHDDDHHDEEGTDPAHDSDSHDHELALADGAAWMKLAQKLAMAPVWVPAFETVVGLLEVSAEDVQRQATPPLWEHAPPDARASGCLLVSRTALPVRGPSLAA